MSGHMIKPYDYGFVICVGKFCREQWPESYERISLQTDRP